MRGARSNGVIELFLGLRLWESNPIRDKTGAIGRKLSEKPTSLVTMNCRQDTALDSVSGPGKNDLYCEGACVSRVSFEAVEMTCEALLCVLAVEALLLLFASQTVCELLDDFRALVS